MLPQLNLALRILFLALVVASSPLAFAQPHSNDLDSDGLPDDWEAARASWGLSPSRANLVFVPVLRPNVTRAEVTTTIRQVTNFFARVPNRNPDGSTGIGLVIRWGNPLPPSDSDGPGTNPPPYQEVRARGMPRSLIGRGHGILIGSSTDGGGQTSGTDWGATGNNWWTIVHELGHQLGLDHEPKGTGIPSPFYTSLMNYDYSYQFNGDPNAVHFSTGKFASLNLNERNLNETISYPIADLQFLNRQPYFFNLRSATPGSTQIDFNRNGVFGESRQMADINGGSGVTVRDKVDFSETAGGFSLSPLGHRLVAVYSALRRPVDWSTYTSAGLSTSNPGQLRYQIRESGALYPSRVMVTDGVTGDPHTLEAFGRLMVTYPTARGYAVVSFAPGRVAGALELRGLAAENSAPSSQPLLIRTGLPEQLYLFLWNEETKRVSYRRVFVNSSGTLALGSVEELRLGTAPNAPVAMSNSPIGGTWDSKLERIALVTTEASAGFQGRMKMHRLGRIGSGWYIQTSFWVGGDAARATLSRPTVLFDSRPTAGVTGQYLIYSHWERSGADATLTELIRMIRSRTGDVWTGQIMGNVWTTTRSAPAATIFADDVAWGWRVQETFTADPNRLLVFMRGSGVTDAGITDHNDVAWISREGLRLILGVRPVELESVLLRREAGR